ncbi:MAG: hypothetical protein ACI88A_004446, partial [Paraglaciecola sp.]
NHKINRDGSPFLFSEMQNYATEKHGLIPLITGCRHILQGLVSLV